MARHATPGMQGFFRELGVFALKVLFWGVVVFGGVVVLTKGIHWLATPPSTTESAVPTTSLVAGTSQTAATTTSTTPTASTGDSTTTSTTSTTTTTSLRDPADILVQVLNSTTRNLVAAGLTETLAGAGYQTVDADNYSHALDQSTVWYAPGYGGEAQAIADSYVPDAVVQESPGPLDVDILVVIGASYEG